MLKIGLTGGIGSGKSTAAAIFASLGIPVYYADDRAKLLMNENAEVKNAIIKNFGIKAYAGGALDRKYLASVVFNDSNKLSLLNSITHPATIADAEKWIKNQTGPYIIKEAALLFESAAAERLDYIIGVYAPRELRNKRIMHRDHISSPDIKKIMDRQMDEDTKMKLCDFIITNDETQLVIPQVLLLHQRFSHRTNSH